MIRAVAKIILIILLAWAMSSCANNASANNGGAILNITMNDFSFDPLSWTVSAGEEVTVNLTNSGSTAHTWTLMQSPISGQYTAADQADILFDSGAVPAGTSKKVNFTAPRIPGNYQVVCIEPDHIEAGMLGLLIVK